MAGIGIQLNRIFDKRTVTSSVYGAIFSINYTIGPMLSIIACMLVMYQVLGFSTVEYTDRNLFSCTMLYVFIFSLLTSSPFNTALSTYISDRIYLEHFEDIQPCAYVGVVLNLSFSALLGIPFYLHLALGGQVPLYYVFTSYLSYVSLSLVWATMVFNTVLKHYKRIARYFGAGMLGALLLSIVLHDLCGLSVTYSMLLGLTAGFLAIAVMQMVNVLRNFRTSSYNYRGVLRYLVKCWKLVAANFLYTLGLFAHNFVFWAFPWHLVVAGGYVCHQPYDMASCLAMLTNISASVFFIARVEMHFRDRYASYIEAVTGGKLDSIEKAKSRMFRSLSSQIQTLAQLQFFATVMLFLLATILLPPLGFSGIIMQIYPLLTVGYFISYLMYSGLLFLYYFNDLTGSLVSSLIFAGISAGATVWSAHLPVIWYGSGYVLASLFAFTYIYFRLRWMEKTLDYHIFCVGDILRPGKGEKPPSEVFRRNRP